MGWLRTAVPGVWRLSAARLLGELASDGCADRPGPCRRGSLNFPGALPRCRLQQHWLAYPLLLERSVASRRPLHPIAHPGDSSLQAAEGGRKDLPPPVGGGIPPLLALGYPRFPVSFGSAG